MEDGGKKVSLLCFQLIRRSRANGKNAFFAILWHKQQVLACCQTHFDYGLSKMPLKWQCKLLVFTITIFHCEECIHQSKAAMGFKRYQIQVKGVNKPAWTAQYESNQQRTSWQVHTGPKLVSMHRPPFLHGCWSHCWWLSQRVPGRHEQCNIHQSQTTSQFLWHQSPPTARWTRTWWQVYT